MPTPGASDRRREKNWKPTREIPRGYARKGVRYLFSGSYFRDAGAGEFAASHVLTAIKEWAKSEIHWVNVYSAMGPVSARLVLYQKVEEHRRWFWAWGKCHVSYWHDPKFYRVVRGALQGPKPAKAGISAK